MQPAFSGYIDPFDQPHTANSIAARLNRLGLTGGHVAQRFASGAFYGNAHEVSVAGTPDMGVTIALFGTPKWQGTQISTAEAAKQLLNAYRLHGSSAIDDLTNRFIAVVVDESRRTAHIAIDRIGRAPLAYARLPSGGVCFSTDARLVARMLSDAPTLNTQSIYNYVFFHQVPSPDTIFAGVSKLQPATRLDWTPKKLETAIYWQPTFTANGRVASVDLRHDFLRSLETGVRSAAPGERTASFLSGGIDSSAVTGFLNRILGAGRPAYTIGFEQAGYDETEYARAAAKHFGADLRVHYISTGEVQHCIGELAALYDEPFGNSSAVPGLVCARLAKNDGIEQMLAGDGGDELFAGNTRYNKQRIFEIYGRMPRFLQSMAQAVFLSSNPLIAKSPLRKMGSYVRQAEIPLPDRLESYNFLMRENTNSMFAPDFIRNIDSQYPFALMREQYWQLADTTTLDRMLYLDWKFTLADNDLRKVNATCRHAGVRVDFPWLDDGVIDLSTRVPSTLKMRGTKLRYFAKQALADFLPQATIAKSKHGFGLPFGQWLKTSTDLQSQVYALLSDLGKRNIFTPQFIERLIAEHRDGHAAYFGTMVWVLAILEAWLQANGFRRI